LSSRITVTYATFSTTDTKAQDTHSRNRRRNSAPSFGADFFVPDAIWYEKIGAEINMDDAKIDESISSMPVMVISSRDIVHKINSFNHRLP